MNLRTYTQPLGTLQPAPPQCNAPKMSPRISIGQEPVLAAHACAETEPEPSSRTGRQCGRQRRTWQTEQNYLYEREQETFCTRKSPSFYPHERTVTPRYLSLSITDSVTSHCITLTLVGSTIKLQEPFRRQETGDSHRTSTHHWRAKTKRRGVCVFTPCSPASSHLARRPPWTTAC
jgi:hypothetical protein